jgi:hypothetical protein
MYKRYTQYILAMPTPTPTPTANPYGPQLAAPAPNAMSSGGAVPAPVPTTTSSDLIRANMESAQIQNALIANAGGRRGGSRKLRHKRHMRSRKHKRTNRSNRHKRSNRRRRSKRGGATTPSITPRPTATIPQFGSQNAGANAASVNLNGGAMAQAAQAEYDNVNGPSTTTYFQ